ncbi:hypothetical protein K440DRAFT_659049 [Wilcoxina mikolae CBS 423.85]|nr:hypothetical protein K440DRAFT_659049 [Wilcoxina mikolae CBS 423.85]
MARHLPRNILLLHQLLAVFLLLLQSTKTASHLIIHKRSPTPTDDPTPTQSTYPADEEQGKTKNPSLSLALNICFGLFGALFTVAVLFFAWRAARRPGGDGEIKPPEDEDRSAGFLPPRCSRDGGEPEQQQDDAMPRHDIRRSQSGAGRGRRVVVRVSRVGDDETTDVNAVRVLESAHTADRDERVVSWIRDVEEPLPPPPYEREGGTAGR